MNGTGKSTLLKAIRMAYGIAPDSIHSNEDDVIDDNIGWETQKRFDVVELDSGHNVAINCDKFFEESLDVEDSEYGFFAAAMYNSSRKSRGERRLMALERIHEYLESGKWYSRGYAKEAPTLTMDEPTLSLSPEFDRHFFKNMEQWATDFQIIIATNSPFCFGLEANYIDIDNTMKKRLSFLQTYANEISNCKD